MNTSYMSTIQTIIIIITLVIFFGRLFFGTFKRFTPFARAASATIDDQGDFVAAIVASSPVNNGGGEYTITNVIQTSPPANNSSSEAAMSSSPEDNPTTSAPTNNGNDAQQTTREPLKSPSKPTRVTTQSVYIQFLQILIMRAVTD